MNPDPAIYIWDNGGLSILVPKRRGMGYLKTPYWHKHVDALSDIEEIERVTLSGLDGCLSFDYGYVELGKRQPIIDRVMPKLSAYYGFTEWREDAAAFWSHLLPNSTVK